MSRVWGAFVVVIGMMTVLIAGSGSVDAGKGVLTLPDALDNTTLTWTTGGNVPWFGQTSMKHDGVDAGQSGAITHNQSSQMSTQVTGPGTLSFWWKVYSETGHDFLYFSIDGVLQQKISGNVYFNQKQYTLTSGTHTLKWKYAKDASGIAGMDAAWVDQVVWTRTAISLAEALDNDTLVWVVGGDIPWFGQAALSHDHVDAGQSGAITHNQSSTMTTFVTGPGTLSFWWKVSSEANHDYLYCSLDGALQQKISGNVWFTQKTLTIPSGVHTVKWKYAKDASGSAGMDAAWVDQVVFTYATETIMLPGDVPLEMVRIPAGSFRMGRYPDPGEQDSNPNESPRHAVTFASGFWMGKYEVTQAQWVAVMGSNPSYFTGDLQRPVEQVSWNTIQTFITALNSYTGKTFRLPSEAEWEYACRAGTTTRFYWGDDATYSDIGTYAWHWGNSGSTTHAVGGKMSNAWGLYDMSGNVWEWCQDSFHGTYAGAPTDGSAWVSPIGSYYVNRGGGWNDDGGCRSASRPTYTLTDTYAALIGFRLSR